MFTARFRNRLSNTSTVHRLTKHQHRKQYVQVASSRTRITSCVALYDHCFGCMCRYSEFGTRPGPQGCSGTLPLSRKQQSTYKHVIFVNVHCICVVSTLNCLAGSQVKMASFSRYSSQLRALGRAFSTFPAGSEAVKLPELPYGYSALEPVISGEIMELHHSKHHNAYVTNYNKALEQWAEAEKSQDSLAAPKIASALHFNGGGVVPIC